MVFRIYLIALFLIFSGTMNAQQSDPSIPFAAGNFEECITVSDAILKNDNANASANYFKGASLLRLTKYEEGLTYLKIAEENAYQPQAAVRANLLRAHAGLQQTDIVVAKLTEMVENGFSGKAFLELPEFSYLKNNSDFTELTQKVEVNANPCRYNKGPKKLDFWIGEWDVYTSGSKSADSKITKGSQGCTLHEDYQTAVGFSGRSISYFDPSDSLYKQTWVDKFNSVVHFKEIESREGYLQMETKTANGTITRMSYEYDPQADTVTQTLISSSDEGATWVTSFVGLYKRKSS